MRPIPDYPDYYVTHLGDVISYKMKNPSIIKPHKNRGGYLSVLLWNNNQQKRFYIHRLVATVYISNPNNLEQVDHINHNKEDNSVYNLRWIDGFGNQDNRANPTLFTIKDFLTDSVIQITNLSQWCRETGVNRTVINQGHITGGRYQLVSRS